MTSSPDPGGRHRFAFDYYTSDGEPLGSVASNFDPSEICDIDWEPARESLLHLALRRDLPQHESALAPLRVAPVWAENGAPYCRGVRVSISSGGEPVDCELEPEYFRPSAERAASALVEQGKLGASDRFLFHVCAYPHAARATAAPAVDDDFRVELAPEPLAVGVAAVAPLEDAATLRGADDEADVRVFFPDKVLEEVTELARAAGELESGGVLAGRLQRCPERGELFVEVTVALAARHAEARESSFTFTPETWAAVDSALALRGGTETAVGWFHSHPQFCRRCPGERQAACAFAQPFFSGDDKHLHRTVFPLGHQVGLLISDLPRRGLVPALFGWRSGVVVERGFHQLA